MEEVRQTRGRLGSVVLGFLYIVAVMQIQGSGLRSGDYSQLETCSLEAKMGR